MYIVREEEIDEVIRRISCISPRVMSEVLVDAQVDGGLLDGDRPLYASTFSRTARRLYGGAKGLVMWY
jgi:hypothetical protein